MARGVEGMRGTLDGNRARSRKKTAISLVAFPSFLLFFFFLFSLPRGGREIDEASPRATIDGP